MTGSLFAPLPISSPSPVRPVASNYSVDSFSEYSTRNVNRASCSPTSVASGPRSGRAKEVDEELFRDLFAGEDDVETKDEFQSGYTVAAPRFIPQKPAAKRTSPSTGNPNPRLHLAPMKSALPQPLLPTPFIPRLKLEELVKSHPDDDSGDENNHHSRGTSRLGSELKQVTENDESCSDDGPSEDKVDPRKKHSGFTNYLSFATSNQRSDINDKLDQETLRFLEKLDLKAVLHTPRPDILSFYPAMPTMVSLGSPQSKISNFPAGTEDHFRDSEPENDQVDGVKKRDDVVLKEPVKIPKVDVASRLAYMKSTYGTAPIVRKTRRETINRLSNPISGHSSTLQALSPRQREKREAALTTRAPLSPMFAAITVSCRRGTTTKKTKNAPTLLGGLSNRVGDSEIPISITTTSKRKLNKRQDPLVHKRRSTNPHTDDQVPTNGLTKRKSKSALGSHSLVARKEALKKKLQSQSGPAKRSKIGGSTFLTQRDDEEGVELIEDFIARNRRAAQTSLTFRTSKKTSSRQVIPALPKRNPSTDRSRPRPTQTRTEATFTRSSSANKSTFRERGLGTLTERKNERPINVNRGRPDHEPAKLFQRPRRPQIWQAKQSGGYTASSRSLTGRPTSATNPLRKMKVHPTMPSLLPRAPRAPPSAATTVLMGSAGSTTSEVKSARAPRRGTKKISGRKADTSASFDAPTKVSEQRKRTSTSVGKAQVPRQLLGRRSTSRV